MDVVDDNEHARICPALIHHRQLRFLLMAEAPASIGDTLHHNTALRFSPTITQCEHVLRTCSRTHIEPFHEHTPIHTLPQIRVLLPDAANTLRVGIWRLETEHKRVLRGVMLTPRAHIMTALALHFAPTIDTSHALVYAMEHTLAHSELNQFVRLIPPSFLRWLIQEFDIKGQAYSTPLTCIDAPFHDNGIITEMPTFLRGVSIHPSHQTQHPISFDDQFFRYHTIHPQCNSLAGLPYYHLFSNGTLLPQMLRDVSGWTHRHSHWWISGQTLQPKDTQPLVTHFLRSTPPRTHLTHFPI